MVTVVFLGERDFSLCQLNKCCQLTNLISLNFSLFKMLLFWHPNTKHRKKIHIIHTSQWTKIAEKAVC